jgi:hypothetical protein
MREEMRKYFAPAPTWAWLLVLIGAILAFFGVAYFVLTICLWVVALLALVWHQVPADSQIDAGIAQELESLQTRALSKMDTAPSELVAERAVVLGPALQCLQDGKLVLKTGKDGALRYSPMNVTMVNFTAERLLVYSCAFDLVTGTPSRENTDEYFYRDVVSVATKTASREVKLRSGVVDKVDVAEIFQLTTSGGSSVEVLLTAPALLKRLGARGAISTARAEAAVSAVRKMLREKKTAIAS